jgi:hypothetical protein
MQMMKANCHLTFHWTVWAHSRFLIHKEKKSKRSGRCPNPQILRIQLSPNPLNHSGTYTYGLFYHINVRILAAECVNVFHIFLRMNSDYFLKQIESVGFNHQYAT